MIVRVYYDGSDWTKFKPVIVTGKSIKYLKLLKACLYETLHLYESLRHDSIFARMGNYQML
jgi:hypothetical protein